LEERWEDDDSEEREEMSCIGSGGKTAVANDMRRQTAGSCGGMRKVIWLFG
jgi:hypothetical protein